VVVMGEALADRCGDHVGGMGSGLASCDHAGSPERPSIRYVVALVVNALPSEAWSEETAIQLGQAADTHDFPLRFALLRLAARYSASIRLRLMAEARNGSMDALAALGDVRNLPPEVVTDVITRLSQDVDHQIRSLRLWRMMHRQELN
jgi:hypothetical protein